MTDIEDTLKERESTYGDFSEVAKVTQAIYDAVMIAAGNAEHHKGFSDIQTSCIQMISSKLARIACGDPDHLDSWHDIEGYCKLAVKELINRKTYEPEYTGKL